jgi:hypothetical protein
MTPLEFLREEFDSVERALGETLRYDYGPERSRPYYDECGARLARIKTAILKIAPGDIQTIRDRLDELSSLAGWISLIERSHLGEFSWPFAEELRDMAKALLAEKSLSKTVISPIIHIIAEGEGYQIVYERQVPTASGEHRFAVIAFPRPLKHHVLLHTIFGHELGHTALHTTGAGGAGLILQSDVMTALTSSGPMTSAAKMTAWLNDPKAPREIKNELSQYSAWAGRPYAFEDYDQQQWLDELICDLFGLLLFGPGFAAAHETILRPAHPSPYRIDLLDPTHPPYAVRHKMLKRAMQLLRWDQPVTAAKHKTYHQAEIELLTYAMRDPYVPWSDLFGDLQLKNAIKGVQKVFSKYGSLGYKQPDGDKLVALVERLTNRLPPIIADIDQAGKPQLSKVEISQTLYAGWVYWVGRKKLVKKDPLSFLLANKLCDRALLQQRAINIASNKGAN